MFFDVVIKVVESRAVKLSDLLEPFFELYEFEFGQIFVKIFRNGFACRFEDGVPIFPVVVTRQRKFVHDKSILHLIILYILTQLTSTLKLLSEASYPYALKRSS